MLSQPEHLVRHFRDVLVWPVQIRPGFAGENVARIDRLMTDGGRWALVDDEFTADPTEFQERHYKEFVAFLPYVQRFLYGESRSGTPNGQPSRAAPMAVYRRTDVAALSVTLRPGDAPIRLRVAHVDLYLFLDMDVALLNVEVAADDLPLATALELLYRFGRAYPTGWDEKGQGVHNVHRSELLDREGRVLASSDSEKRERYLQFVCRNRAPCVGALWAWLLRPLVLDQEEEPGELRFRLIEYYRMPMMAYLAVDEPRRLSRSDFVHLGLVTGDAALPGADLQLADFEQQFCYDRFWVDANGNGVYDGQPSEEVVREVAARSPSLTVTPTSDVRGIVFGTMPDCGPADELCDTIAHLAPVLAPFAADDGKSVRIDLQCTP